MEGKKNCKDGGAWQGKACRPVWQGDKVPCSLATFSGESMRLRRKRALVCQLGKKSLNRRKNAADALHFQRKFLTLQRHYELVTHSNQY